MKTLVRFFTFSWLMAAGGLAQVTDVLHGHFETHVDYDGGFSFYVSYNTTGDFSNAAADVRMASSGVRFVASPACYMPLSGSMADIGTPGSMAWIMPQTPVIGAPYLGIRAVFPEFTFYDYYQGFYHWFGTGSIRYIVESVTGTGPAAGGYFGMHTESLGESFFLANTRPGSPAPDQIEALTAYAHEHFSWIFTHPGTYDVVMRAHALLLEDDSARTGAGVYHFSVPFSSSVSGVDARVRVGHHGTPSGWHLMVENPSLANPAAAVVYASDQALVEVPGGAVRSIPLTFSALGSPAPNCVGQIPALAAAGVPDGALAGDAVNVQLISVTGPGHFTLLDSTATTPLMSSADGVTHADVITFSRAADLGAVASFSAEGLYRVVYRLSGISSGQTVSSQPLAIYFGVGLAIDCSYAQWADSFERAAGLSVGALANASGDLDADGLVNAHEFQLFWHGCDPTQADAGKLPVPVTDGSVLALDFLRDTYKDRQNGTTPQMSVSISTDLNSWITRTLNDPGYPDGVYETGSELGNAHGRIMRRRLRIPGAGAVTKAFGRFHVGS